MRRIIKKKKRIWIILLCLCFFGLSGCGKHPGFERDLSESTAMETTDLSEEPTNPKPDPAEAEEIFVHVCGCVKNPGLYKLPSGIRAGEAVEEAGGFTKKADTAAVNLAQVLEDGVQLFVPALDKKEESVGNMEETIEESSGVKQKVNLNTASLGDLTSLSGIGETRAEAILAYREEKGSFSSIEDIKNVSGIGDGIFEKIKDSITV